PVPLPHGRRRRLRWRRDRRLGRGGVDLRGDRRAARRSRRDRDRHRRRRGADPARRARHARPRRSRDRDPRGRSAELVVAARGAVVRAFAGASELTDSLLRDAPVHWPRPSVLDVSLQALEGVGPKTAEAAAEAGVATVGDLLLRFPHSHRDRTVVPVASLEPGRKGTIAVEVLGSTPRPFRRRGLSIVGVKVGDDSGTTRATWFNQPWVAPKLVPGTSLLLTGSTD